jgi:hypothetical protein
VTRFVQWLLTLPVAALGFALGVNHAEPKVYRTDAGTVRISIRAALPGNLLEVQVPQIGYRRVLHPFRVPLEWRARALRIDAADRRRLRGQQPADIAKLVLQGRNAVVDSALRSFYYGAIGAGLAALALALVFILAFGGLVSRLFVAVAGVLPLLVLGALAYLIASYAVTP